MKKVTIELDTWGHKELKEYLLTVNGISEVDIDDENNIKVSITYDSKITSLKIIRMELDLFFNKSSEPTMLAFDKHREYNKDYTLIIKDVCCEYCFKGMIEELYEIDGIGSATSNYDFNQYKDIPIFITYNENIISLDNIKKIENRFNE
jgi:copper chaperone CopZ